MIEKAKAMNEYQRQAYLSALGLDQYVPRWRLPCAPAPVVVELPVMAPAETASGAAQNAEPEPQGELPSSPAPTPQALTEVLRDMSAPAPAASTDARPPAPLTPQVERLEPFSLSIWRSPLPLLVLDARKPRAAMPTERLLRNILSALAPGGGDPQSRPEAMAKEEILPWPSVNNPALQLRVEDARAELHTWLEIELSQRPVNQLLLMGENAARHFLPEGTSYPDCLWQQVTLEPFGCSALVAPSLLELLQRPRLKRDLWQALQPLLPSISQA